MNVKDSIRKNWSSQMCTSQNGKDAKGLKLFSSLEAMFSSNCNVAKFIGISYLTYMECCSF